MLDALKNLTGGKNKLVQKQTDELELLLASAREERAAISAMLTTLTARSQKLAPLSRTLEQTTERVTGVTERLDDIAARLAQIDDRAKALEEVDVRIQALKTAADQAEQTTHKALGPDGELQQLREALHQLSSQALSTYATVETLKKERASLDEVRGQLRKADSEVKLSLGQVSTLKTELDQVRATATALSQDYGKIGETSREAREGTAAALATAKDVERRLSPLTRLLEMSKTADERLASLSALAEHVAQHAKALETQQQAVEHVDETPSSVDVANL